MNILIQQSLPPLLHQLRLANTAGSNDLHNASFRIRPSFIKDRKFVVTPNKVFTRARQL